MNKKVFEDELIANMQQVLVNQSTNDIPNLSKAAECLHSALEIFEEQGLKKHAAQVMQVLEKIAKSAHIQKIATPKLNSIQQLMEAGVSQRDLREFTKGNPVAIGKLNLVLHKLGISDHEIIKLLGPANLMTEEQARKAINPNESSPMLEFRNLAQHKIQDPATKGLTPEKQVNNLKQYGTPLNVNNVDDLMSMEVKEDTLEAFDDASFMSDFEDEKD